MADATDVMAALAGLAATALYPNGTSQPSVAGVTCKVYPGWPTQSQLDADLLIGTAHVTAYARPEEKNTTRYMTQTESLPPTAPTLTLEVVGQQVTVGGAMPSPFVPHNLAVFVDGKPYLYSVQPTDTLAVIATGLATVIAVDVPGTVSVGPVVSVAAGAVIGALRVGTAGSGLREIRRQQRLFQVVIWADTPAHRDAISAPIDEALSDLRFITLADGTAGRIIYQSSPLNDGFQKEKLYRRDLFYTVEYGTTKLEQQFQIIAVETNVFASASPSAPITTIYQ